ncbi:MAG TPA: DUF3014 domain-containing protein [Albitalea sp.]
MNRLAYSLVAALAIALFGIAAYFWLSQRDGADEPVAAAPPSPPAAAVPAPPPAPPASAVRHPIEPAASAAGAEPPTVEKALTDLFGRKAVLSLFQLDDFPRRFVATVDNLARAHAPPRVWPVNPAEGRFTVATQDGKTVVGADNALRYTPYILLLETVDLRQAAAAYRALYPMFQHAYVEQGYPQGYFNDRLVEVIDHLLRTPEPAGPLEVYLPEIKGPVQPERPWVLYEFADPALASLSAGQKMLLRMGPVNQRRVKGRLEELRRLVAAPAAGN